MITHYTAEVGAWGCEQLRFVAEQSDSLLEVDRRFGVAPLVMSDEGS